ncbi:DUF6575 domain-containing protein [Exiguobacterium sp. s155]|uniref:DUF6575 domain-containing protein n=1 Tax=Exiguobacterium sp. s155 TaxID=2751286 RepID=UPI001BEB7D86|nr:DUF6575 domain-containing protein [Exiguobacterium sp. s155]
MSDMLFTPLGNLEIKDVFFYYDGPRIFSCKNKTTTFLAFLVEEFEEKDLWLFTPISNIREHEIKKGKLSIREAIVKAEDSIYEVYLPIREEISASMTVIDGDMVPIEYLPSKESFVRDKYDIDSELPPKPSLTKTEAIESRRDVLDISIETRNKIDELPSIELGKLLINTQNVIYGLDERWTHDQNKPPKEVIEDNSINVTMLFASSFGIRIKSSLNSDLFDSTPTSKSLKIFTDLLNSSKDEEELEQLLKKINSKAVMFYKEFLNSLDTNPEKLKVEWASPSSQNRNLILTADEINKAKKIVSNSVNVFSETYKKITIKGELTAINLKRNTFYIEGEDGEYYSGSLSKEIADYVREGYRFEIPKTITALLETKTTIYEISKKENSQFTLLKVIE